MGKKNKKILLKIGISLASVLLTLFLAGIIANHCVKRGQLIQKVLGNGKSYSNWTIDYHLYSPKYISWQKRLCPWKPCADIKKAKPQKYSAKTFGQKQSFENSCQKILFLGDSFSTAPFSDRSYIYYFTKTLANNSNHCITAYVIASGGSSTSQELAKFSDLVTEIKPNIVIWQFFFNDFFENVTFAVHDLKNGQLIRKKAWKNAIFWAGFLNQKIPYLKHTQLGKYILTKAEKEDVFHNWPVDPRDSQQVIVYNQLFIPAALRKMEQLSQQHDFKFYSTLAPLECQRVSHQKCQWQWQEDFHNQLRTILLNNSFYLDMEHINQSFESATILGVTSIPETYFAGQDAISKGSRHLSEAGEKVFGLRLVQNYLNQL